jgi:hypothetical protein
MSDKGPLLLLPATATEEAGEAFEGTEEEEAAAETEEAGWDKSAQNQGS